MSMHASYRRRRDAPQILRDPRKEGALCDSCPLRGAVPVFGEGPLRVEIAVVGEAPGSNEVEQGRPFIGRSGELLEQVLAEIGLPRSSIYIDNALLCMPPGGDLNAWRKFAKRKFKAKAAERAEKTAKECEAHGDRKGARAARGAGRAAAKEWRDPVECCRPRLFNALHVKACAGCGRYPLGAKGEVCSCGYNKSLLRDALLRDAPPAIIAMGATALEALTGLEGISKWRGSPLEVLHGRANHGHAEAGPRQRAWEITS